MIKLVQCIFSNSRICAYSTGKMSHKVFVYGTLKRNEPNHNWLTKPENGSSKFVSEGTTKTKYPLIIGTRYNIPFLLQSPGDGHHVKGEIYEVDDLMLSNLDILEEHPRYYVREEDDIIIGGSGTQTTKCWVYFIKKFKPELLKKPTFENYSSKGPHGLVYMERSRRDPTYDYKPEIKASRRTVHPTQSLSNTRQEYYQFLKKMYPTHSWNPPKIKFKK